MGPSKVNAANGASFRMNIPASSSISRKRQREDGGQQHWPQKKFACSVCGKQFESRNKLDTHFRIHTGEKPFPCTVCGKRFRQRTHLRDHQRIHTGEKPFECPHCGKRCNNRSNFNKHFRVHTGEKPYGCAECGKRFSQKSNLTKHIKIHTAEKTHVCETCGKMFRRASHLKTHMKQHTMPSKVIPFSRQGKNHVCNQCGHAFSTSAQLRRHYRVHTGEKPFPCDICGRRFTQKGSLTRHIRTHMEKMYDHKGGSFNGDMAGGQYGSFGTLQGGEFTQGNGGELPQGDLMQNLANLQAQMEKQLQAMETGDDKHLGPSSAAVGNAGEGEMTEEKLAQELARQQAELEAQLRKAEEEVQNEMRKVPGILQPNTNTQQHMQQKNVETATATLDDQIDQMQRDLQAQLERAQKELAEMDPDATAVPQGQPMKKVPPTRQYANSNIDTLNPSLSSTRPRNYNQNMMSAPRPAASGAKKYELARSVQQTPGAAPGVSNKGVEGVRRHQGQQHQQRLQTTSISNPSTMQQSYNRNALHTPQSGVGGVTPAPLPTQTVTAVPARSHPQQPPYQPSHLSSNNNGSSQVKSAAPTGGGGMTNDEDPSAQLQAQLAALQAELSEAVNNLDG